MMDLLFQLGALSADETQAASNDSGDPSGSDGSKKDAALCKRARPSNGETLEHLIPAKRWTLYECRPSLGVT